MDAVAPHRRADAGHAPQPGIAAAERQPQPRGPAHRPRDGARAARASTPASWSWCARRRRASRRSSGWPTATPSGSPRSRCSSAPPPTCSPGDPVRVLAVLVVATPCPLILATPVAVVGGINRAARRGIIFRHGAALEQLGRHHRRRLRQDRTLTIGRPRGRAGAAGAGVRAGRGAAARGRGRARLRPPARPDAVEEAVARGSRRSRRRARSPRRPAKG